MHVTQITVVHTQLYYNFAGCMHAHDSIQTKGYSCNCSISAKTVVVHQARVVCYRYHTSQPYNTNVYT